MSITSENILYISLLIGESRVLVKLHCEFLCKRITIQAQLLRLQNGMQLLQRLLHPSVAFNTLLPSSFHACSEENEEGKMSFRVVFGA